MLFALESQSRDVLNFRKICSKKQTSASTLKIALFQLLEMVYFDVICPNLTHPTVFLVEEEGRKGVCWVLVYWLLVILFIISRFKSKLRELMSKFSPAAVIKDMKSKLISQNKR